MTAAIGRRAEGGLRWIRRRTRTASYLGGGEAWRYGALAVPSIILVAIGVLAVTRRDITAA